MTMKTIDAKGKLCPVPLIMTKKVMLEAGENEDVLILVDNENSMKNVKRFLEDHDMPVTVKRDGNAWEISVNNTGTMQASAAAESYCQTVSDAGLDYLVAVQRDKLGDGDDELGKMLLKAFLNTLPETTNRPSVVVFMNAGIFMALNGSPVLESLKKLEAAGTEILVCGTCLEFYKKKDELAVGMVSNMYDILEHLSKAGSVLYP